MLSGEVDGGYEWVGHGGEMHTAHMRDGLDMATP